MKSLSLFVLVLGSVRPQVVDDSPENFVEIPYQKFIKTDPEV